MRSKMKCETLSHTHAHTHTDRPELINSSVRVLNWNLNEKRNWKIGKCEIRDWRYRTWTHVGKTGCKMGHVTTKKHISWFINLALEFCARANVCVHHIHISKNGSFWSPNQVLSRCAPTNNVSIHKYLVRRKKAVVVCLSMQNQIFEHV